MNKKKIQYLLRILPLFLIFPGCEGGLNLFAADGRIADHSVVHELWNGDIAERDIRKAVDNLVIAYGHTSHGSQIVDGMSGLTVFADNGGLGTDYSEGLFDFNSSGADGALHLFEGDGYGSGPLDHDAGYYPDWVNETELFLSNPFNSNYNVIMWSWCGQVSGLTESELNEEYLDEMNRLEQKYPDVVFIYMTGHLDGTGEEGNLHQRNEQIREYCRENRKWLFDFADIESYDPDGNYYLDLGADDACGYSGGNWAVEWQDSHTEGEDWYSCGVCPQPAFKCQYEGFCRMVAFQRNRKNIIKPADCLTL